MTAVKEKREHKNIICWIRAAKAKHNYLKTNDEWAITAENVQKKE